MFKFDSSLRAILFAALWLCLGYVYAGNSLPSSLAAFGGAYETLDAIGDNCNNSNVLTHACSCPGGTTPKMQARVINDHNGPGTSAGGNFMFCSSGAPSGSTEFLGAYQLDDAVAGGFGCRMSNTLTGNCSCPAGATVTSIRTLVDGSNGLISSTIGVCSRSNVVPQTFGGAYQVDDSGPNGPLNCRASNSYTGSCSCPSGFVRQAIRSEAYWTNNSTLGGTTINLCVKYVPPVAICTNQMADPTGTVSADAAINACISSTPSGGTLELPAGTYSVDRRVNLIRSITLRTKSVAGTDEACGGTTPCATFMASSTFNNGMDDPSIQNSPGILGAADFLSNINVDHLIIDGNRYVRLQSTAASKCAADQNQWGINARIDACTTCSLKNSISKNALCGTGFGWGGVSTIVLNNKFLSNGDHEIPRMWSDGLTIQSIESSEVANNTFIDNTDVGLIIGNGYNSVIHDNIISQQNRKAFSALMLNSMANTSLGNFNYAVIRNNAISCAANMCFYAVNIGDHAWVNTGFDTLMLKGGTFTANTVSGGVITLNVDGAGTAAAPLTISSNVLTNTSPNVAVKCFTDTSRALMPSLFNAGPNGHAVFTSGSTQPTSSQITHYCY